MNKVRWGIIGTGAIAKTFARNLTKSETGELRAVGSRNPSTADRFGDEFAAPKRFGRYEDLLGDPTVDAVYIATPHPMHAMWAIRAAEARKHLLVEKPLAVNHGEAMAIVEAAIANDVFLMEAFMYRCHPQTRRLIELIRDERAIGDVRMIDASFSVATSFNPESRLFKNALAGGGILDVGCYPISMARLIAGTATGNAFPDPVEVKGVGHLGKTGVDEWAIASLRFEEDIVAQVAAGVSVSRENVVRIFGTKGMIFLSNPWVMDRNACERCTIVVDSDQRREISVEAKVTSFTYEADVAGRAIAAGRREAESPAMSWADSLGNMKALDAWRESIGLSYEFERFDRFPKVTVSGRPLAPRAAPGMSYGHVDGIDLPVSRLVMGCDNQMTLPHATVMFDDFFDRGGNCFDTAHIYSDGLQERLLGQWMKLRGVRDQMVLICKGGHTPYCDLTGVSTQLQISLERLQTDCADIYLLHRDNPDVPVGEFVDVLNEHVDAGHIKVFGGSNWSTQRVDEANEYARRKGVRGFSVISNNFSLARMIAPIWHGCISASDGDSRAWLTKTQTPLLAWSSQARGFFVPGRAAPDKLDDEELVRAFYSEDNFQRLQRANELAAKKGASANAIALAYVLNQDFPTFALIGPRFLCETRTSLQALQFSLTAAEVKWLNFGT